MTGASEEKFLLLDLTAGAYWRPNSAGYTCNRYEAGHFSNDEINGIAARLKDRRFRAEVIPTPDETEGDYLRARINALESERDEARAIAKRLLETPIRKATLEEAAGRIEGFKFISVAHSDKEKSFKAGWEAAQRQIVCALKGFT